MEAIGMIVAVVGAAYVALVLWLAVRIFNRRERWAKWTAAAVIGLPGLYVFSFGPACWIASRTQGATLPGVYQPVLDALLIFESDTLHDLTRWYAGMGMSRTGAVYFPLESADDESGVYICNYLAETGVIEFYFVEGRWSAMRFLGELGGKKYRTVPAPAPAGNPALDWIIYDVAVFGIYPFTLQR
jgi:hypothetical protein